MSADAFYVYVAAPMSGYPGEYLANCARMSTVSRQFMDLGMCPINAAGDMLEGLACPKCNLSKGAKHPSDFAGLLL